MAIQKIVTVTPSDLKNESASLFRPSEQVDTIDSEVIVVANDLCDTMRAHSICVGLAATQIGVNRRIVVINTSQNKSEPDLILINPKLISTSGKKDIKRESCMSLIDWTGNVERREKAVVSYNDLSGKQQEIAAKGYLARVLQHEIDHLDGKLYAHRLMQGSELVPTKLFYSDVVDD